MNRRGQTLVLFVLLLPLFLFLFAYVVDMGKVYYEQNHLKNLLFSIDARDKEKYKEALFKNDQTIKLDTYKIEGEKITVEASKDVESLFGKIIGINKYHVKVEEQMKKEK